MKRTILLIVLACMVFIKGCAKNLGEYMAHDPDIYIDNMNNYIDASPEDWNTWAEDSFFATQGNYAYINDRNNVYKYNEITGEVTHILTLYESNGFFYYLVAGNWIYYVPVYGNSSIQRVSLDGTVQECFVSEDECAYMESFFCGSREFSSSNYGKFFYSDGYIYYISEEYDVYSGEQRHCIMKKNTDTFEKEEVYCLDSDFNSGEVEILFVLKDRFFLQYNYNVYLLQIKDMDTVDCIFLGEDKQFLEFIDEIEDYEYYFRTQSHFGWKCEDGIIFQINSSIDGMQEGIYLYPDNSKYGSISFDFTNDSSTEIISKSKYLFRNASIEGVTNQHVIIKEDRAYYAIDMNGQAERIFDIPSY